VALGWRTAAEGFGSGSAAVSDGRSVVTEPAPQSAENVIALPTGTVPAERFHAVVGALESKSAEHNAALTALVALENRLKRIEADRRKLIRELADERGYFENAEEITRFLTWFCGRVGREPKGANISLVGDNARRYRWLRRTWTDRQIAFMVVGLHADEFHSREGYVDLKYLCSSKEGGTRRYDEGKCERFLRAGELVRGERAGVTL